VERKEGQKSPMKYKKFPRIEGHNPHKVTSSRKFTAMVRKRKSCKERKRKKG
jgi:hypothetical protein